METFATVGMFYLPFWRGIAGMAIGAMIYRLHQKLPYGNCMKLCAATEFISLAAILILMMVPQKTDGAILLLLMILLISAGSPKSVICHLSDCWLVRTGSRYEYAIFLNHAFVIGVFKKLVRGRFGISSMGELSLIVIFAVIYSVITTEFVDRAVLLLKRMRMKRMNLEG